MKKEYPVGSAQSKVLHALGLEAAGFESANTLFTEIGIQVSSQRGTPVIYILSDFSGGFNAGGDGDGRGAGRGNASVVVGSTRLGSAPIIS